MCATYSVNGKFLINGESWVVLKMEATGACCVMPENESDRIIWNETKKNRDRLMKGRM